MISATADEGKLYTVQTVLERVTLTPELSTSNAADVKKRTGQQNNTPATYGNRESCRLMRQWLLQCAPRLRRNFNLPPLRVHHLLCFGFSCRGLLRFGAVVGVSASLAVEHALELVARLGQCTCARDELT